uniref:Chymotrypsin n=1 Tax=Heliothis virescens TaxID=7102 RepID=J7FCI4_HELVI|nr:chymotrypsin [Heliothis virescens]
MRALILLGLGLLASASALVEVKSGYHQEIGIPTAEWIKANEEKHLAEVAEGERIVGGAIAPANAHPYFAGLLISLVGISGNSVCGSTLVSARSLVTAAHCWTDGRNQAWQFLVILGSNQLFTGGTRIATSNVIMHPQYVASTLNNDIAMILLPTSIWFSNTIQPISLPSGWDLWDQFVGNWAVAAGFGRTSDQQAGASTIVSHVNLQVISVAQWPGCVPAMSSFTRVRSAPTALGVSASVGGDSGGPLVISRNGGPPL